MIEMVDLAMTERGTPKDKHSLWRDLLGAILPAIPFGLGFGYATGQYLESFITGLIVAGSITIFTWLDVRHLHPLWWRYPRNLRITLEVIFSSFAYILGTLPAAFICTRIFGLVVEGVVAWFITGAAIASFLIVHAIGKALQFHRELKIGEERERELAALAIEAELRALKAQINPHFLFNTLNTIAELIHTDPARAEEMAQRLADMFRYVLAGTEPGLVPLADELAFVDSYLEIEHARFGERLRVAREISPEVASLSVPSLILQPLVENAVRHGQCADGIIDLTIRAALLNDKMIITVADRGPGMPPDHASTEGRGYGLRNVDERLKKTYGEAYGLEVKTHKQGGTIVTLKIPLGR